MKSFGSILWLFFGLLASAVGQNPANVDVTLVASPMQIDNKSELEAMKGALILAHPFEADKEAWLDIRAKANLGDPRSQVELGFRLHGKNSNLAELEDAFLWFQRAAVDGSPDAMNNVGVLYLTGSGVAPDLTAGIRWLSK